jgi:E3 ubiquitin-protein ligase RGLG
MGCSSSQESHDDFSKISNNYTSLSEITRELRSLGLETCNLMVGIDCTKSNQWTGLLTNNGKSLHDISLSQNMYEKVIYAIGKTLSPLMENNKIPLYGFGDNKTKDVSVFSFNNEKDCENYEDAINKYRSKISSIELSGPTSFEAIINKGIEKVITDGGYHILIIIADGKVDNEKETIDAIIKASQYALE